MKKIAFLCFLMAFVLVKTAHAQDGPSQKLYRGIVNIVTSPIEFPKQTRAYWIEGAQKTDHILVWIGSGVAWGGVQFVKRMGSGLWDVISFPIKKPANYQPLMRPAFVFDEWPRSPVSGR